MINLNQQPAEKPAYSKDGALELSGDPFYTIQGEGPFAGTPAAFVRLAGCNLQCPDCDTDYTSRRNTVHPDRLLEEVSALFPFNSDGRRGSRGLVVVTGGEPFRQDIGEFCYTAARAGYHVQIETNGTAYRDNLPWYSSISVVCSPKTPAVNEELRRHVSALKYVLEAGKVDLDGLPLTTISNLRPARPWEGFGGKVYVQPADLGDPTLNAENVRIAVESCKRFGYTLSLQTHKILGLP